MNRPAPVFVISGKSPRDFPGGLGAYAYNIARVFAELGHETYIIGFGLKNETVDLGFCKLVHVRTPFNSLLSFGMSLIVGYLVRAIITVCKQRGFKDVLLFSAGLWGVAGLKAATRLKRMGIKARTYGAVFSTYLHDYKGQLMGAPVSDYGFLRHWAILAVYLGAKFYYRPIENRMIRRFDVIVTHYDSTREIIRKEVKGLDLSRIVKIPYYVDFFERKGVDGFSRGLIRDEKLPTVTVMCRQDPRKGINAFLKAVRILRDDGVRFNCLVCGKGIFYKDNIRLARKLGLADDVVFAGFVPSAEAVFEATDIYVLPSLEEGAGAISLLEAMKKGVAIVTTICDGIPEDFIPGKTGLLVPMDDPKSLAKAIAGLLADPKKRASLARNVRVDYRRRFSLAKMKQGLRAALQR